MWRIGRLGPMAKCRSAPCATTTRTGLLRPAAIDHLADYRWYGVAEQTRLDASAPSSASACPSRDIAGLLAAFEGQGRRAVARNLTRLRAEAAALAATTRRGRSTTWPNP